MAVQEFNISINQGETWSQELPAVAEDLTGFTGKCQIRKQATASSPAVASPTVVFTDIVTGLATLGLTPEETLAIPTTAKTITEVDSYIYDVFFTNGTVTKKTHKGVVTVAPSVTK